MLDYLNIWGKAIIYKYSADAFLELNRTLQKSKGLEMPGFGELLKISLNKLPDFNDVVYRGVNLSENEIEKYHKAYQEKSVLTENAFISATKAKTIAYQHGNCIFIIISKKGKAIEMLSKHRKEDGFESLVKLDKSGVKNILFLSNLGTITGILYQLF